MFLLLFNGHMSCEGERHRVLFIYDSLFYGLHLCMLSMRSSNLTFFLLIMRKLDGDVKSFHPLSPLFTPIFFPFLSFCFNELLVMVRGKKDVSLWSK